MQRRWFVMLVGVTLTLSAVSHAQWNDNRNGPDNDRPMNRENAINVVVAPGRTVSFTFFSSADNENAICIYNEATMSKVHEAGNDSRSLAPWSLSNTGAQAIRLIVSGWHKDEAPSPTSLWRQGPRQYMRAGGIGHWEGGFEDPGDESLGQPLDYDDITFGVVIQ